MASKFVSSAIGRTGANTVTNSCVMNTIPSVSISPNGSVSFYTRGAIGATGAIGPISIVGTQGSAADIVPPQALGLQWRSVYDETTCEPYHGADFDGYRGIFVSTFRHGTYAEKFHFRMWMTFNDGRCRDHSFVTLATGESWVCFSSQASLDAFNTWMSEYRRRFAADEFTRSALPGIPVGEINGHGVSLPSIELEAEIAIEYWLWIIENCRGKTYFAPGRIIFERSSEAVAFELNFKGR